MISSASSVRLPLVFVSRLRVFHSGAAGLPMPNAGRRRPSDSRSMVAHCLASRTGSRSASDTTFMPNLILRVRPASAAITLKLSRIGSLETSRSVCHSESTPPPSQASTQRQQPRAPSNGNSIKPNPTATVTSGLRERRELVELAQDLVARQVRHVEQHAVDPGGPILGELGLVGRRAEHRARQALHVALAGVGRLAPALERTPGP